MIIGLHAHGHLQSYCCLSGLGLGHNHFGLGLGLNILVLIIVIIIRRRRTIIINDSTESLHDFTRFKNSARRLPAFGPSWWTWAIGPPVGGLGNHIHYRHLLLSQPKSWYSFYHHPGTSDICSVCWPAICLRFDQPACSLAPLVQTWHSWQDHPPHEIPVWTVS